VGQDSVVGITTHYRLDGPGIESRRGEIFHTYLHWPWGPPSLLYNGYQVSFLGVKWLGRGIDHPPPSSAKVKRKSRFIPLLPLWAFMTCSRVNFTLLYWQNSKEDIILNKYDQTDHNETIFDSISIDLKNYKPIWNLYPIIS
jgi:hypothetical protein